MSMPSVPQPAEKKLEGKSKTKSRDELLKLYLLSISNLAISMHQQPSLTLTYTPKKINAI